MRSHELSCLLEKDSQSVFSTKKNEKKHKKKEKNQNQNQITKIGKNVMNIVQFSIALVHTRPTFTTFQDKGCMHLHPKNHVHIKCIDFSLYTNFPKSNVLSFEFRMRGPLKESISYFLKVFAFIFHRTQSPLSFSKTIKVFCLAETSMSSAFTFQRLSKSFGL